MFSSKILSPRLTPYRYICAQNSSDLGKVVQGQIKRWEWIGHIYTFLSVSNGNHVSSLHGLGVMTTDGFFLLSWPLPRGVFFFKIIDQGTYLRQKLKLNYGHTHVNMVHPTPLFFSIILGPIRRGFIFKHYSYPLCLKTSPWIKATSLKAFPHDIYRY